MDEIIVRVLRCVACWARLRILSALARTPEIAPTDLAQQLKTGMDSVCVHLKHLSAAGLMQRRRSGRWCYCVAASPYTEQTFSGKVSAWLYRILRDPAEALHHSTVDPLRKGHSTEAEARVHAIVFEAATAFDNVCRLQILRRLGLKGAASAETLCRELSISAPALSRHMAKLARRGYVGVESRGQTRLYGLSPEPKTPLHGELFQWVSACWTERQFHS